MFTVNKTNKSTEDCSAEIEKFKKAFKRCQVVIIGAGAGLSTSAGLIYAGERLKTYFYDFVSRYGFQDMYSAGFYPFPTPEEMWAYWSRHIYINRYMNPPRPIYQKLFALVKDKDYFVLTTNVDHCFQKAAFDKQRLFYTQGDYGLFQCSEPCHQATYDNEEIIKKMLESQGFTIEEDGSLKVPESKELKMTISSDLVPYCPRCGKPMSMNLRADDTFVEDEGWHNAARRYMDFLKSHKNKKVLFWEMGVGMNTPTIIKFSFWRKVYEWSDALYACISHHKAYPPKEIQTKSIYMTGDIGDILEKLSP